MRERRQSTQTVPKLTMVAAAALHFEVIIERSSEQRLFQGRWPSIGEVALVLEFQFLISRNNLNWENVEERTDCEWREFVVIIFGFQALHIRCSIF